MTARPDWAQREAALTALLSTAAARSQLLAALADYSAVAVRDARACGSLVPSTAECRDALEWLLHPVFICGQHRSGTTLLQSLLDGHPELVSLPSEGTYFSSFAYVAWRAPAVHDMDRFAAEWISRFVDPNFEPHFRLGRSDGERIPAVDFARRLFGWHEALRGRVPGRFAPLLALVAAYRATVAPASTPRAWVEKTPLNELRVRRFAFFGSARFVQLVRDPRAVLASLERIHSTAGVRPFDAAGSALTAGRSLRAAAKNPRRLGSRYLVVRYEDLVGAPMQQMERVRLFLGIESHAALSTPTAGGIPVAPNSSFGGNTVAGIALARPPPVLPDGHLALLGVYAAAAARAFGYELPVPTRGAGIALRVRYWPRQALRLAGGLRRVFRSG